VVGNVGQAGSIFSFVTTGGGLAGKADSNGSHDFTIVQLAGGLAYIYPGLLSEGTMSGTPLGGTPVWVPLLSLPVPVSDKLVFGPAILPYATTAALGHAPNAPSVSVLSLNIQPAGLGLTVKDSQGRVSGIDPQTDKVVSGIPGSFAAHIGNVLAVVIPGNLSAFSYFVDGIRATQPSVNFTVTLQSLGTTGVSAEKDVTAAVAQGSVDTFSASAGPGEIDSVQLFQVSLSAMDLVGLPAPGTSVTLVSPTGTSTNLALGESKMVPGGNYSVSVNYAGRTTHESFVVTKDGTIPVKVSLSYYSILIIGVIVAAICGIAVRQARRVKKSVKKNVKKIKQTIKPEEESEWLK